MADQIQLSVRVDTAQATGELKKFGTTAKTEMKAVESTSTTSLSSVSTSTQTMGQRMAGAGAAISAANASLQLMGRQGPPALQTLAAGAASVAVSGFGPLSIAIVAVTTALSLFTAKSEDTSKTVLGIEEAVKSLAQRVAEARKELDLLTRFGGSSEKQREDQIERAEKQVARLESRAQTLRTLYTLARAQDSNQRNPFTNEVMNASAAKDALQLEERRFRAAKARLRLLEDQHEVLKEQHQVETAMASKEKAAVIYMEKRGKVRPNAPYSLDAERVMSRAEIIDSMISRFNRGTSELEDRPIRALSATELQQRTDALRAEAFGAFGSNEGLEDFIRLRDEAEQIRLEDQVRRSGGRLTTETAILGGAFGLDLREPSAEAKARSDLVANNLASSFSQALITQDYSGVGRAMALSFVDQVLQAIAAGAIQATGLQGAVASGFQSLGSVFGGGVSEVPAEGTG